MNFQFSKILFLIFLCTFIFNPSFSASNKKIIVNEIIVKNNQRIDTETIISYLGLQKGSGVNYEILNKRLKEMYKLGLFEDIKFRVSKNNLIVIIKENPMINNVYFFGNKKIKEENIVEEIQLKSRNVFQQKELQSAVNIIRDLYKRSGYFSAKIETKISTLSQNRIDITFNINEGNKTKIKGIKFLGNKVFSDKRLKGIVSTKESKLWRLLSSGDIYDPDRINYDKDLLRRYYLQEGYADFRIISAVAELTKDKTGFFITYSVEEGDVYKFGNVKIDNANFKELKKENIEDLTKNLQGKKYSIDKVDQVVKSIKEYGGNFGYAFLNVRPNLNKVKDKNKIDVVIKIDKSKKIYVSRIDIKGNNRTKDKVIRREMRFNEGDSFSNEKLKRSEQRIRNLGFFDVVNSNKKQTKEKDRTNIVFNVKEKQTGQFSIGGGFSSTNGALANVGISERNFLGKGQDLRAKFTLAERATQLDFGFTEPYFRNKDINLGVDVFKIKTTFADESSFDNDTIGAGLRLGYMITERTRHSWNYSFKDEEIEGVKSGASDFILNQKGNYKTSSLSHRLSFYGINDRLNPTKGSEWSVSNKVAGFGGTVSYFKTDLKHSFFYSVYDDYVFATHLKGGYIFGYNDDDVKLKDRYFLGGDSFPGFEQAGIGPRDTSVANKDALGGNLMYTVRTELQVPIPGISPQLGITGAFFGIAGAATEIDENGQGKIKDETSPRVSVGFGVQWKSPFGPVRVDFAHAVMKEDFDRTQFLKFNFGAGF
tara:strand:+ start:4078 stop:6372 length:2295 start_codon:yes stop_codon:yes gene_type:complete